MTPGDCRKGCEFLLDQNLAKLRKMKKLREMMGLGQDSQKLTGSRSPSAC